MAKITIQDPHKDVAKTSGQWARCRDVYDGSDAVKAKGTTYLPKLPGHNTTQYEAYKLRAGFFNAFDRTLKGLLGSVMRKDPAIAVPDAIVSQLVDVTGTGVPLVNFAQQALEEVLKVGRFGVLLDMPEKASPTTPPYWVPYKAEQIHLWREDIVAGERRLRLLVLTEEEKDETSDDEYHPETVKQLREVRLERIGEANVVVIQLWRESKDKTRKGEFEKYKDPIIPTRRGAMLDEIPFVCFGPTDLDLDVKKPPLLDLADKNLEHYRTSADLEHGRHFTALPQPCISGVKNAEGKFRIGSSVVWTFEDPQAKAYYLEFTGQGLAACKEGLDEKREEMAILGAKMLEGQKPGVEAAATVQMRHAGDSATLKSITGIVSLGLSEVLRWHVYWSGLDVPDEQVSLTLNTDFFGTLLSAEEVKALILALQGGQISYETFYFRMSTGGWTEPGVTSEQEQARITATREAMEFGDPADKEPDPEDPEGKKPEPAAKE